MATDNTMGLFGMTPESYQLAQQKAAQEQAMQFAGMDPFQQANYGNFLAGSRFGGAIGQALGAQDPQLQKISTINALSKQFDVTTAEGLAGMSKAIASSYPDVALQLAQKAQEMRAGQLDVQKKELSVNQEEQLRKELAALGPDATQADVLKAVTKYGSADKVIAALQASADRNAQLAQAKELAQARIDAQIEAAKERGATQVQIAQMQIEGRKQIADLMAGFKQGALDEKKQKEIDQKAGLVQSFDSALETLDTLKVHPGKKSAVGFGGTSLSMIPGTDAAGFAAQLETFKAQTFLPQVQALKGMGALSDAEGKKLTAAVGALSQTMKPAEFDAQLDKIKRDLSAARARLASSLPKKEGVVAAPATGGTVKKWNEL